MAKRKVHKNLYKYTDKVTVPNIRGEHTSVKLHEFAHFAYDIADPFDLIVCIVKVADDMGVTDRVAHYAMNEVVNDLVYFGEEDPTFKADVIKQLNKWLKKLKKKPKKKKGEGSFADQ